MRFSIFAGCLIIAKAINPQLDFGGLGYLSVILLAADFIELYKKVFDK